MKRRDKIMKKLNKKGFTLVEMLVVIAIIAVLVAIIVPTTSSATNKAKASANAANLRSVKAEIGIALLTADVAVTDSTTFSASSGVVTVGEGAKAVNIAVPEGKTIGTGDEVTFHGGVKNGEVIVQYGKHTINDYATFAESGSNLGTTNTLNIS